MWAAIGIPIRAVFSSQQTLVPLIFTSAEPEPSGSPFGVSAFPVNVA
jgi:hypothetical protein